MDFAWLCVKMKHFEVFAKASGGFGSHEVRWAGLFIIIVVFVVSTPQYSIYGVCGVHGVYGCGYGVYGCGSASRRSR